MTELGQILHEREDILAYLGLQNEIKNFIKLNPKATEAEIREFTQRCCSKRKIDIKDFLFGLKDDLEVCKRQMNNPPSKILYDINKEIYQFEERIILAFESRDQKEIK